MSNQAVNQPVLALMAGLPGVGKTTLARHLEGKLSWSVIDKDTIKDELLFSTSLSEEEAGKAAFNIAFGLLKDALASGHSAILDSSALHPFIIDGALQLCDELRHEPGMQVQLKVVLCEVDNEIRKQRLQSRKRRPSQRRSNMQHLEEYQRFNHLPSERLTLRTDESVETYAGLVASYLTAHHIPHLAKPAPPPNSDLTSSVL